MSKKNIALLCGEKTTKTLAVAQEVIKQLGGEDKVDLIPVETAKGSELGGYNKIIFGSATWHDGELPFFWDEFLPDLERTNLKGKKVAIFGLGNKLYHGENFCDAIGMLATLVEQCGGEVVGETEEFRGLALDYDNDPESVPAKVADWLKRLGW